MQNWTGKKNDILKWEKISFPLIWYMVFRQNIVLLFGLKKGDLTGGQSSKKEGKMEKKYLKKVLTGLSIASLVTGLGGLAIGAGG